MLKGSVSEARKGSDARRLPIDIEVFLRWIRREERGWRFMRLAMRERTNIVSFTPITTPVDTKTLANRFTKLATSFEGSVADRKLRSSTLKKRCLVAWSTEVNTEIK